MSIAVQQEKTTLNPLLLKLSNTKRFPHGILLFGENESTLWNEMCLFSETINNTTIPDNASTESDYYEPTADIIILKSNKPLKIDNVKNFKNELNTVQQVKHFALF